MRKTFVMIGLVSLLVMVGMPWVHVAVGAPASKDMETLDPKAVEVMQKMGTYMAGLQSFKVHSNRIMELILPNDQKLHSDRSTDLFVQRPDRMRVTVISAKRHLELFYDGKTFTLYSPREKFFASVPAKPTISEMIEYAETEYDIEFPLVDVLYHHDLLLKDVVSGTHVGTSLLDGVKCHQLAFRQKDIDWQAWIEAGEKPLLRRLIISDKSQKGEPLTIISLSNWDVAPALGADLFTFTPTSDVQKIKFVTAGKKVGIQGPSTGANPAKQ